ncbi:DnaB-like replicative helicase [Paracoccus phage ParMal1]|uniref:DnaB-like replicative helicase n=1 Tax=Paracoccus phage ParMal1 TaxID=3032416 RepID=A0AAF0JIU0_9CAUD|nr:DnaB-like replicative helicase [Paracoccus phage ParMal1]
MIDLKLLQILKYRDEYRKVIGRVPMESMENTTVALLKDFGKYFDKFPTHEVVNLQTFAPLFSSWHPKLSTEQKHAYANILKRVKDNVPEDETSGILHTLLELRLSADLAKLLLDFEEGDVGNIHGELDEIMTTFQRDARIKGLDYVRVDVDEMLNMEINEEGMRWRLQCLNDSMRGLRPGDFGIVAGRPDKGKTTFLASEITALAAQSDRPVIWMNNEGPGNRIYTRLWQAALGLGMSDLIELHRNGRMIPEYEAAVKGDQHKIRVFDIHGMDTYAVERIIEQHNPSLVVYDMIDNVRGFGDAARTDLALEKMYQWARELCVKYDCAGIATSQISADGADTQFPADHMLKDSKTGKQGACDFILMIGAVEDPGYANARFIGLPKNKLRREGAAGDPRACVSYKPQIARYEDLPEVGDVDDVPETNE